MRETKQRSLILEIVNSSVEHLSAEDIYHIAKKEMPNISLGTVYRNLNLLFENCSIRKIKLDDNIDYYDNLKNNHWHFICTKCNKIYDVFEKVENHKKVNCGIVMNYEVIYRGICKYCMKEDKNGIKGK